MKKYKIQDREAGNVIESGLTQKQADQMLVKFEDTDKAEGNYTPDFYEIVRDMTKTLAYFKAQYRRAKTLQGRRLAMNRAMFNLSHQDQQLFYAWQVTEMQVHH